MSNSRFDEFRELVQPALRSKLEEFALLGYETVDEEQLWTYLTKKKWKKEKNEKKLFELVDDILSVTPGEYMGFATVEALKSPDLGASDVEDFKELFK
ncbi:post-transcriptional regulator [Bacillus dakarensis]|uniref:post-transcriptional regulator n=1 Tax=Robertmurraya dakarensis TaxID=1926278 RepID=UPI000980ED72|nr:post-transcriptional regulator [Bacillus dakarensis]